MRLVSLVLICDNFFLSCIHCFCPTHVVTLTHLDLLILTNYPSYMYVLYEPGLVGQMYFSSGHLLTKEYSWSVRLIQLICFSCHKSPQTEPEGRVDLKQL